MDKDTAAVARRLALAVSRPFVGVPIEWFAVQMRSEAAGWPDWIDISESGSKERAHRALAEIARAAAECPELGIELQVVTRQVLS